MTPAEMAAVATLIKWAVVRFLMGLPFWLTYEFGRWSQRRDARRAEPPADSPSPEKRMGFRQ